MIRARRLAGGRAGGWVPALLVLGLLAAIVGSLCIGAYPISFWRAGRIVLHLSLPWPLPEQPDWTLREQTVIQVIRLPRVLLATFAGIALGLAGATLQGMMRNPLVGPDLIGVSSGAAFGGVMAVLFDFPPAGVVALAFCGGLAAMAATFALARLARGGIDSVVLILAGIFVGAFAMSCVGLAQFLANDGQLVNMVFWLLGTFSKAEPQSVALLAVPTLAGGAVLMLLRWRFNLLSLGDLDASLLGGAARPLRWVALAVVTWMVAAQVAVSGVIGWVGLVIPHAARMLVGPDHRRLLPASALLGGMFVLGIDGFTRAVVRIDLPVGVMTTLIGTPLVGWLFWRQQTKGWIDA